jgi:hypothetical protein
VINVEESALRAFEQNLFFPTRGFVEPDDGVRDEGREVITGAAIFFENLFVRERFRAEGF